MPIMPHNDIKILERVIDGEMVDEMVSLRRRAVSII